MNRLNRALILSLGLTVVSGALASKPVQAALISFNDTTLGNGSFSWLQPGFTLSASASSGGVLSSIPSGEFAGLWISQSQTASGVYTLTFSQSVTLAEFQFDALSGNGPLPVETIGSFSISSGLPTLSYVNLQNTVFDGSTITQVTGVDNGKGILTVTSASPFTSLSFVHSQNPGQNGFVIERVTVDTTVTTIPESSSTFGLIALGTLGAASTLKRKLKSSKSTGKETTKVG